MQVFFLFALNCVLYFIIITQAGGSCPFLLLCHPRPCVTTGIHSPVIQVQLWFTRITRNTVSVHFHRGACTEAVIIGRQRALPILQSLHYSITPAPQIGTCWKKSVVIENLDSYVSRSFFETANECTLSQFSITHQLSWVLHFSTAIFSPVLRKGGLFIAFSCLLAATTQWCSWNEMAYLMAKKNQSPQRLFQSMLCTNSLHNKLQTFKTGVKKYDTNRHIFYKTSGRTKKWLPQRPSLAQRCSVSPRLSLRATLWGEQDNFDRGVLKRSSIQTFFSETKTHLTDILH